MFRCPVCAGTEVVYIGDGWAECPGTRVHKPRGPQDLFDGRRCHERFWVGRTADEERRLGDAAWARAEAIRDADAAARAREARAAAVEARLNRTVAPAEIAQVLVAVGEETRRSPASGGVRISLPLEAYRDAWRRLVASGALDHLQTHDLVRARWEPYAFAHRWVERSRAPAWRPSGVARLCVDGEGSVWNERGAAGLVRSMEEATFLTRIGAPIVPDGRMATQGAGPIPTSSALASHVVRLVREIAPPWPGGRGGRLG